MNSRDSAAAQPDRAPRSRMALYGKVRDNLPGRPVCNERRMPTLQLIFVILGFVSLIAAASYAVLAVVAVVSWHTFVENTRRRSSVSLSSPPVTVLKPLCGAEPGLYENLRSFCTQDYPQFEIVFGVRDSTDPACLEVGRLAAEFPGLPIKLVVDPELHGSNRKVSNLINMLPHARYDVLAMADSDACVGSDYLTTVTAPLRHSDVGLVTCLYCGIPTKGIWSRLGAMYINEWYMPTVLLTWLFGYQGYVSGQTLCIRRDTLQAIGGLQVLANQLAEDYRLGELVRGLKLRIVLSPYLLNGEHHEPDLRSMSRHELRWMRTIRALRPRSFIGMFVTFSLPLALLGIICAASARSVSLAAWVLFAVILIARMMLHFTHRLLGNRSLWSDFWLLPVRDLLLCWVWCRSLFTSRVNWRGNEFDVGADGVMRQLS
jgi:ceramide glucosyltransferase